MRARKRLVVAGAALPVLALGGFALYLLSKVLGGKSTEMYTAVRGARWNYGVALSTMVLVAVCLAVAFGLRALQRRRERRIDDALRADRASTGTVPPDGRSSDS